MKIGFLYAGQGAQHVGMGKDLYEAYPEFREVFDNVKLDFDVKECCFDGPIEKLGQTRYTQPCMVAFAVGVTKILAAKGIVPEIAAGLSLGEYSALYAAGVFEEQQVIDLVAYRGKAMEEAVEEDQDLADMGQKIADRANHLQEAVKNLEEDLEHKVSVDELSAYLEMPEEEIKDILRMAGEEIKVDTTQDSEK